MDHEHEGGSSRNLKVHFDVPPKEVDPATHSQISASPSLSDSSLDLDDIDKVLHSSPLESEEAGVEKQGTTSSADQSAPTPVMSNQNGSATQCPPIQLMGRPSGYDPNRIPSSVFSSKPSTPMDWSTASNESLFSIHIGNNSFSRDHFIMINKSGELPRMDELNTIPANLHRFTEAGDDIRETYRVGKDYGVTEAQGQTSKVVWGQTPGDENGQKVLSAEEAPNCNTVSCRSDESNNSGRSFHFPL